MSAQAPVAVADFKARWGPRHFRYGAGFDAIQDADILEAFTDALDIWNPALFDTPTGAEAFLLLAAHYVRENIQATGGLAATPEGLGVESQSEQTLASAGANGVSQAFVEPPPRVKNHPIFLPLWNTPYGQKYVRMALLMTTGAVGSVSNPVECDTGALPWMPYSGT